MTLSTHVLDTTRGIPAVGVGVELLVKDAQGWRSLARTATDNNGRVLDLVRPAELSVGTYRLVFDTASYFLGSRQHSFYPEVMVTICVTDALAHYHVPLLLSPFSYSTYRGS